MQKHKLQYHQSFNFLSIITCVPTLIAAQCSLFVLHCELAQNISLLSIGKEGMSIDVNLCCPANNSGNLAVFKISLLLLRTKLHKVKFLPLTNKLNYFVFFPISLMKAKKKVFSFPEWYVHI